MLVLGIESSCDETAAAILDGPSILSNIVASQIDLHARYGGIVPELAARKHVEAIGYVIDEAVRVSGRSLSDLRGIAVTNRYGLVGSLLVGVAAAKTLAYVLHKPLAGIHHIEGHIFSGLLSNPDIPFPHLCLTASGGHTMLIVVEGPCRYRILGHTLDDAAGEAYDKIAKFMGLTFPGGPIIDKLAKEGNNSAYQFPRPLRHSKTLDFSFSGLKTAVVNMFKGKDKSGLPIADISASFQEAVVGHLMDKTLQAASQTGIPVISVTGGVAVNSRLRERFRQECSRGRYRVYFARPDLCGDNAAMVAAAGHARIELGDTSGADLDVFPSAPLLSIGEH